MFGLFNLGRASAGFVAVLVGYTSSAAIIFQAANSLGASAAEVTSWFWALGIGLSVLTIGLSWWFRSPVMMAWSTPGAALLVTGLQDLSMAEAVAVFLLSSVLILITGLTKLFDRLMRLIPGPIAAAMLAGVLLRFGLDVFVSLQSQPWLVGIMLLVYLVLKPLLPRYCVPLTLVAGLVVALVQGDTHFAEVSWQMAQPHWVTPEWNWSAMIGVGVPLFLVTMASQNMPGLAVIRAHGYHTPASPIITASGFVGVLLAPFGGFAYNLAAITAAICMGEEADPDPKKRYWAAIWAGIFYALAGLFAASVVAVFDALPLALVAAIAGLALLATIGSSLQAAVVDQSYREAAIITFLVTASGLTIAGIGSAFWGLMIGVLAATVWGSLAKPR
ncbi:benzoate/H(+) symporter BenE family transporter [Halioxenophilus sp. WMMB6]|uniref:benzoate/H(+) symporter BenE family transporter n=1 Tax=Halioxenophilus sp. WMMB6 TaxID=3073815 RepID=UPI00295EACA9|nr:benzoate/H(+) symporter BenE family transporter [Halioxenophilus sp. WMMB6]